MSFNADVCIFDTELLWKINNEIWHSKGHNTPYWGKTLKGRVTHTVQNGRVIYSLEK